MCVMVYAGIWKLGPSKGWWKKHIRYLKICTALWVMIRQLIILNSFLNADCLSQVSSALWCFTNTSQNFAIHCTVVFFESHFIRGHCSIVPYQKLTTTLYPSTRISPKQSENCLAYVYSGLMVYQTVFSIPRLNLSETEKKTMVWLEWRNVSLCLGRNIIF